MLHHTYRFTTHAVTVTELWRVWADVNQWHTWQSDIDYARLETDFVSGGTFLFKPKGAPKMRLGLTHVSPERSFTDSTRFIGAQLLGTHEFIQRGEYDGQDGGGVDIVITLALQGMLAKLWWRLVVQGIADSLPVQTEAVIARTLVLR